MPPPRGGVGEDGAIGNVNCPAIGADGEIVRLAALVQQQRGGGGITRRGFWSAGANIKAAPIGAERIGIDKIRRENLHHVSSREARRGDRGNALSVVVNF